MKLCVANKQEDFIFLLRNCWTLILHLFPIRCCLPFCVSSPVSLGRYSSLWMERRSRKWFSSFGRSLTEWNQGSHRAVAMSESFKHIFFYIFHQNLFYILYYEFLDQWTLILHLFLVPFWFPKDSYFPFIFFYTLFQFWFLMLTPCVHIS